ncbi:MAG: cyclic nucleotide-binding domain-containing protein [Myxococcaceae bacterium]
MAREVEGLKSFLANIAVFGGLEDGTLDRIIGMLVEQRFDKGAIVCREGETGRSMYVVRAGEVVVCRRADSGLLVKMVRLGAGEFFGEMTLIDIQPRSATVVVETPSTLYALTNKDLYRLYQDDVAGYVMVLQNICRELSRRLRKADVKICQIADDSGDEGTQIGRAPVSREPTG